MKPEDIIKVCIPVNKKIDVIGKGLVLAIIGEQPWVRVNILEIENPRYEYLVGKVFHLDYDSTEKLNRKLFLIVNNG